MSQTSTLTLPPEARASLPLTANIPSTLIEYEKVSNTTAVTLRSLYSRATRAFLQRDINLTHTLITSALPLIPSPSTLEDSLSTWRRKWEILRVTLETTAYASPPADPESLPSYLRSNLMLSPQSFLVALYTRSLMLFTPLLPESDSQGSLNVASLPAQVLMTLVLAGMKLGVPDVGRGMIEDWLARRNDQLDIKSEEGDGYAKIIELYCLHILPRLEEWDYAAEFLQYETRLEAVRQQKLMDSLEALHFETKAARHQRSIPSTPPLLQSSTEFSRPVSPSGSSASSSSEHTATPQTHQSTGNHKSLPMPLTSISAPPSTSNSTNTSRTATPMPIVAVHKQKYRQKRHSQTTRAPVLEPPASSSTIREPSMSSVVKSALSLLRTSLASHAKLATLLLFVFALFSFIRVRRSRRRFRITGGVKSVPGLKNLTIKVGSNSNGKSAVDEVRKNLASTGSGPASSNSSTSVLGSIWNETVRAVGDTVRMGGRGLI